jgi:hypothetical protein
LGKGGLCTLSAPTTRLAKTGIDQGIRKPLRRVAADGYPANQAGDLCEWPLIERKRRLRQLIPLRGARPTPDCFRKGGAHKIAARLPEEIDERFGA